jgi:predicted RNase H-like nuclease (RuvC/YqgF family)
VGVPNKGVDMTRTVQLTEEEQKANGYTTVETLNAFTELAHSLQDRLDEYQYENYKLKKQLAEMRDSISSLYVASLLSDSESLDRVQKKVLMDD